MGSDLQKNRVSRPSRRAVLAGGGAAMAAMWAPGTIRVSFAAGPEDKPLVVILLRGGLDSLALFPPHSDPAYFEMRNTLALPPPSAPTGMFDLDGGLGLHPMAAALLPYWTAGNLAIAPAVAGPYDGTVHEEAIGVLDSGLASYNPDASEGWVNRAIVATGATPSEGEASLFSMGNDIPLAMRGAMPAEPWVQDRMVGPAPGYMVKAGALYQNDPFLMSAQQAAVGSQEARYATLGADHRFANTSGLVPSGLPLMAGPIAERLLDPAAPNVAVVEIGGWDTHYGQGAAEGPLARSLAGLAEGIAVLARALSDRWQDSMILVASEFGRSVRPNGNGGTDHGGATAAMVLGGGLAGRVVGNLPSLSQEDLRPDGGVTATLDTRAFLKGALAHHWSIGGSVLNSRVFPESSSAQAVGGF